MISGRTVEILRRNVPHYHVVAAETARKSVSVCPCVACANYMDRFCCRVRGKLDAGEEGLAIVAWNGTCDKAERKRDWREFTLEGGECNG